MRNLGDTTVAEEDWVGIDNLQGGGKPERETAHEKPK